MSYLDPSYTYLESESIATRILQGSLGFETARARYLWGVVVMECAASHQGLI